MKDSFMVVIGGISGSGKTVIVEKVAEMLDDAVTFFYDHYPEMEEYMINERKYYGRRRHSEKPDVREKKKFDTMYPKGNKIHTFDYYLYALADYLRRKRKINLYIGLKNNILYPSIPAYFN